MATTYSTGPMVVKPVLITWSSSAGIIIAWYTRANTPVNAALTGGSSFAVRQALSCRNTHPHPAHPTQATSTNGYGVTTPRPILTSRPACPFGPGSGWTGTWQWGICWGEVGGFVKTCQRDEANPPIWDGAQSAPYGSPRAMGCAPGKRSAAAPT
jgi:hypothetical protein